MHLYTFVLFPILMAFVVLFLLQSSCIFSFSIVNLKILSMDFSLFLSKESNAFILTVLTIFLMVFNYSFAYLASEVYLKRFLTILALFVASMLILISSSDLFSSLVGWDGLGVTSMFLILFYYSKSALKAGTLTFLMNRVGDCFFILTVTQVLILGETWCNSCFPCSEGLIFLLILTSITKSAQIPFSTWLPAAMEAPTPVSALVHSSTLVTAGIFLLYQYSSLWMHSSLKDVLMVLSVSTCFMAALSALVENDLKKLIALSTLSQLGFIMYSFSLGILQQGFMHMLMHAFFKALLFMSAGLVIHSFKGSQCLMSMSLSSKQNPLLMTIMSCALLSMSGLPFLSGFFSKDLILDSMKASNWAWITLLAMVVSFMCTIMYSIRVVWYLLNSSSNWHTMSDGDLGMIKPMIPLAVLAVTSGSCVSWLMMESSIYIETSKVPILVTLGSTAFMYWKLKDIKTSNFLEKKWNLATFNSMASSFFYETAMAYKHSSDLLGIPELYNKWIKASLNASSMSLEKTMMHYSGAFEFLLFVVVIIWLL